MDTTQITSPLQSLAQNRVVSYDITQATLRKIGEIEAKLKLLDENNKEEFTKLKDELLTLYRAHFDSLSAIVENNEDLGRDK
jgi:hypothetical protein